MLRRQLLCYGRTAIINTLNSNALLGRFFTSSRDPWKPMDKAETEMALTSIWGPLVGTKRKSPPLLNRNFYEKLNSMIAEIECEKSVHLLLTLWLSLDRFSLQEFKSAGFEREFIFSMQKLLAKADGNCTGRLKTVFEENVKPINQELWDKLSSLLSYDSSRTPGSCDSEVELLKFPEVEEARQFAKYLKPNDPVRVSLNVYMFFLVNRKNLDFERNSCSNLSMIVPINGITLENIRPENFKKSILEGPSMSDLAFSEEHQTWISIFSGVAKRLIYIFCKRSRLQFCVHVLERLKLIIPQSQLRVYINSEMHILPILDLYQKRGSHHEILTLYQNFIKPSRLKIDENTVSIISSAALETNSIGVLNNLAHRVLVESPMLCNSVYEPLIISLFWDRKWNVLRLFCKHMQMDLKRFSSKRTEKITRILSYIEMATLKGIPPVMYPLELNNQSEVTCTTQTKLIFFAKSGLWNNFNTLLSNYCKKNTSCSDTLIKYVMPDKSEYFLPKDVNSINSVAVGLFPLFCKSYNQTIRLLDFLKLRLASSSMPISQERIDPLVFLGHRCRNLDIGCRVENPVVPTSINPHSPVSQANISVSAKSYEGFQAMNKFCRSKSALFCSPDALLLTFLSFIWMGDVVSAMKIARRFFLVFGSDSFAVNVMSKQLLYHGYYQDALFVTGGLRGIESQNFAYDLIEYFWKGKGSTSYLSQNVNAIRTSVQENDGEEGQIISQPNIKEMIKVMDVIIINNGNYLQEKHFKILMSAYNTLELYDMSLHVYKVFDSYQEVKEVQPSDLSSIQAEVLEPLLAKGHFDFAWNEIYLNGLYKSCERINQKALRMLSEALLDRAMYSEAFELVIKEHFHMQLCQLSRRLAEVWFKIARKMNNYAITHYILKNMEFFGSSPTTEHLESFLEFSFQLKYYTDVIHYHRKFVKQCDFNPTPVSARMLTAYANALYKRGHLEEYFEVQCQKQELIKSAVYGDQRGLLITTPYTELPTPHMAKYRSVRQVEFYAALIDRHLNRDNSNRR